MIVVGVDEGDVETTGVQLLGQLHHRIDVSLSRVGDAYGMGLMEMLQLSRSSYGSDSDLPTFSQTPSWVFLFLQVVTALIRTVQSGGL